MRIAVINDLTSADINAAIIEALAGRGHAILNVGMTRGDAQPALSYLHTGFLAGLLLGLGRADLVIGGCSSGQGFLSAAMQYPGVFCGLIRAPLDAWLFAQINAGNCISLPGKQGVGFGHAAELRFIFDRLFEPVWGGGYPLSRAEPQAASRLLLTQTSQVTHRPLAEILAELPGDVIGPALTYPGVWELLDVDALPDAATATVLRQRRADYALSTP